MDFCCAMQWFWIVLALGVLALVACNLFHRYVQGALTLSVFALALVLFLPWVQKEYAALAEWKQLFLAGYHSLRLFILEGDYQQFLQALPKEGAPESYRVAMLAIYFAAPITTVTMIASYFENVTAWLRLHTFARLTGMSVFSELNDKSLALAKSIRNKHKLRTMVFYDVYRDETEHQTELLAEAKKLGALCFRCDVLRYKPCFYAGKKEFFIIGSNESENIGQAIQLAQKNRKRKNFHVYVWAHGPESTCILDSLDLYDEKTGVASVTDAKGFKLRRVDDVERFVWNTLKDAKLFDKTTCVKEGEEERLSILIVGMGDYGVSFLKTALWMYQRDDVQLEITAVDSRKGIRDSILHQCPELEKMNDRNIFGESRFSVRFLEETDIFSHSFDQLVLSGQTEMAQRLRRTTAVFVTLGDDDTNIRAAMELRQLFDRVAYNSKLKAEEQKHKEKLQYYQAINTEALSDEEKLSVKQGKKKAFSQVGSDLKEDFCKEQAPKIFTPVYDVRKTENVTIKEKQRGLHTYDEMPYHICFLGSFAQQYNYETVTREKLEREALAYHLMWTNSMDKEAESILAYGQYEYCRRSSMAQAIHKDMLKDVFTEPCKKLKDHQQKQQEKENNQNLQQEDKDELQVERKYPDILPLKYEQRCNCSVCQRRCRVEHMRWNTFMRTEGYCTSDTNQAFGVKLHRSKIHCNLVTYDELDEETKAKDANLV